MESLFWLVIFMLAVFVFGYILCSRSFYSKRAKEETEAWDLLSTVLDSATKARSLEEANASFLKINEALSILGEIGVLEGLAIFHNKGIDEPFVLEIRSEFTVVLYPYGVIMDSTGLGCVVIEQISDLISMVYSLQSLLLKSEKSQLKYEKLYPI